MKSLREWAGTFIANTRHRNMGKFLLARFKKWEIFRHVIDGQYFINPS